MSEKRMLDGLNRGHWQPQEDLLLKKFIEENGVQRWSTLPSKAGLKRCGKSCRLRWMNYLRPNVKRGHISEDEKDLIIRLHKLLGNRWSLIAARVPGRTDNDVKNFWNIHLSKKTNRTGLKDNTHVKMTLKSSSKRKYQCHNLKPQTDSTPSSVESKQLRYHCPEESDNLNPSPDMSTELKFLRKDCNSESSTETNELLSTVYRTPSPSKTLVQEDSIGILSDIQESSNGILSGLQETLEFVTTSSQYQFDVLSDSELFRIGCVPWLGSNEEKFDCSYVIDSTRYFIDEQHNNLISPFDLSDMWC